MKKLILFLILIICLSSVIAYDPPTYNSWDFVLEESGYTPPSHNTWDFVLGAVSAQPCTYSSDETLSDLEFNCDVLLINDTAQITLDNTTIHYNNTNVETGSLLHVDVNSKIIP